LVKSSSDISPAITTNTICGFPISIADMAENLAIIDNLANTGQGGWVVTLNTEMLAKCARDEGYASLLRKADLITADGMPLIWASRHNGQQPINGRTTGVDLIDRFLKRDVVPNYAIIGGVDPETTLRQYPNATESCTYIFKGIVDLGDEQMDEFANTLKEKQTRIVFLALGVPKQDKVALAIRSRYPEAVLLGIGGTFEILSPSGGRAPMWMQNNGLEWLYRFLKEPRRLWKRYLLNYPVGVSALLKDLLKK